MFFRVETTGIERRFIPVPDVTIPGVVIPGVPVPGVADPGVPVPSVAVPSVPVPSVAVPGVAAPGVEIPGVAVPSVPVPGIITPSVPFPGVPVPGVAVPSVAVPRIIVPGVPVARTIFARIDKLKHFGPRDFTHNFQFVGTRFVTYRYHVAIGNNFGHFIIAIETVIIETIGGSLTKMHSVTANLKFAFFFKFAGTGVLFSSARPIRVKYFVSSYLFSHNSSVELFIRQTRPVKKPSSFILIYTYIMTINYVLNEDTYTVVFLN